MNRRGTSSTHFKSNGRDNYPTYRQHLVNYYQDILLAILVFMLKDRARKSQVRDIVARQLQEAETFVSRARHAKHANSGVMGAVLHDWHRNYSYLDEVQLPRFVRLHGRAPSVAALVRSQDKRLDADSVADEMVQLGLIKRDSKGRYSPVARVATIRKLTPALIDHVARSLERLLATVNFNTRGAESKKSLIERTAFVHDLPAREARAFRAFAQRQGSAFLANADEWLESRRAPRKSRTKVPLIRAGIHVYAFEEKAPTTSKSSAITRTTSSTRRATRAG